MTPQAAKTLEKKGGVSRSERGQVRTNVGM
jgi:hypothetical protein